MCTVTYFIQLVWRIDFRDCKDRVSNIGIKVGGARVNNIRYADGLF